MFSNLNHKFFLFLALFITINYGCHPKINKSSELGSNTVARPDSSKSEESPSDDYYVKDFLRFENHTYNQNIKTVILQRQGDELSYPEIKLGSEAVLQLSFDDLDPVFKNYKYTFIHCNPDWEPSNIMEMEYLDGFYENYITDYSFSFNTIEQYIHYSVTFPNNNVNFLRSGNYIIKIVDENAPEDIILTRRFMIYEEKVIIDPTIKSPTIIQDRNYKQEIDFTISHAGYPILNPYDDLKVVLLQNFRWDNAITKLKPLFVRNEELVYDYDQDNVFPGGNEYRMFDIKNFLYRTERMDKVIYDSVNHVYLMPDEKRSFKRYFSQPDINGKFVIRRQDGNNSEIEADYALVHFRLKYPAPLIDGNLYVFGALSDWNFKKECKMQYDYETFSYHTSVYLKQGYYNYEYMYVKDGENTGDNTLIEGMHFETENDYFILVYHKETGTNYYQLVGYRSLNTQQGF